MHSSEQRNGKLTLLGDPRQLGTTRTPWNGHGFQGGVFLVYQKGLSATCEEGDSVLQS